MSKTANSKRPARPELISVTEAADRLGVHYRNLRRWIADGKINAVRIGDQVPTVPAARQASICCLPRVRRATTAYRRDAAGERVRVPAVADRR